ncbi:MULTISPECIES: hypothetical protein [unclassified Undibacterium]|uniref:hypothetical protein n=1 Tax=unclassified Undibacterium TaxID=2630295 RepID=UPI002AC8B1AE|nr:MULTISPECIES: hypothetical protein [unclassified Undibacterium]MEB0138467.1 hypothetical protein [Undibacterium sp. CCC2.1]MEB0173133.1 hypothetical protein [Undibacterium sp. CCC1.1]MEB0177523.1 hypothetical protein [Undibacterium sp. CCC3.4]MEB0216161.1 hypothetical protein [Undibacterium sp. 5I2]WPX42790.1 hypothetical protein RHM61_15580 [Undibacterium sp. CCC3.4]
MNYFPTIGRFVLAAGLLLGSLTASAATNPDWYRFDVNPDQFSSITDFSALNQPLTAADRVFAKDAHFYRVGADGKANSADDTRVRFFGISLAGAANFPTPEQALQLARRLRSLGFNAVRLHHLDSVLSDSSDDPQGILGSGAFPSFNPVALSRLRGLIDALKQEGLYVNLNLHVGYTFRYAVDQVTPLPPGSSMPFASHPLHLFEPRMLTLQVEYAQQLIRRLHLNEDSALAMIEISNESSLLGAWQRRELDALPGEYQRLLQLQWQHWIVRQYGSVEQACARWDSCGLSRSGALLLQQEEARVLTEGSGWLGRAAQLLRRCLRRIDWPLPALLETQYVGAERGAQRRVLDFTAFLVAMDKQYLDTLRAAVRAEVGPLVPLSGTQMYFGGILNADAQRELDYVDEHVYVDHYDFPHQPWDRHDWRIRDQSALREGWEVLLKRAFYRDRNKPFVISEYNQAYPNHQSAEIIPVMAALASMQDWDGLFFFHYGDLAASRTAPDSFALKGQGGQLVTSGSAAALFRLFQIPALPQQLSIVVPSAVRHSVAAMAEGVSSDAYLDYLRVRYGITVKDAFFKRIAVDHRVERAPASVAVAALPQSDPWRLKGRELVYRPLGPSLQLAGRFSALFAGFGDSSERTWLTPSFAPLGRQFGVFLLSSRDALPLNSSRRMLLTVSAATSSSQPDSFPERAKNLIAYPGERGWWTLEPDTSHATQASGPRDGSGSMWLEQIAVKLFVPRSARRVVVFPLNESGQRQPALPAQQVQAVAGGVQISLNEPNPWFELLFLDD